MSKKLIGSIAAVALGVSSIASSAYAAPIANPASSLSLSNVARTGSVSAHKNKLAGGGAILAVLILGGVAAIIAVAATKDNPVSR